MIESKQDHLEPQDQETQNNQVTESIIRLFPDPSLREPAKKWEDTFEEMPLFLDMCKQLALQNNSITLLTGPNVGFSYRIIFLRTPQYEGLLVNPEFMPFEHEGKSKEFEGCISMPGIVEKIERWNGGYLKGFNEKGERVEFDCSEDLARAAQAGIEALDGKIFIDNLGQAKRMQALKKYNRGVKKYKKAMKYKERYEKMKAHTARDFLRKVTSESDDSENEETRHD